MCSIIIKSTCNANVNAVNNEGFTALMEASLRGSDECMSLLLKAKANVEKKTPSGKTALSLAIENNQHKCVSLLRSYGAKD